MSVITRGVITDDKALFPASGHGDEGTKPYVTTKDTKDTKKTDHEAKECLCSYLGRPVATWK